MTAVNSFYSREELEDLGFACLGTNVLVSRKASIYGAEHIRIGNNVRIDDFSILSGQIELHDFIHIAAGAYLFAGDAGIRMHDFTCVSSRSAVYAITDDYSGEFMTNSMVPEQYRNVIKGMVILEEHTLIGSGCTILPGVRAGKGSAAGSMSLILHDMEPYSLYVGIPARKVKDRKVTMIDVEKKLRADLEM
jgi:galactoside O-acetyltransferase